MDILCIIWINVLPVMLLFLLYVLWKTVRRRFHNPLLFDLIAYFATVKIILNFSLPAFLRVFSDWQFERQINASPFEIAMVYTIEFVSYTAWMLSILFASRTRFFRCAAQHVHLAKHTHSIKINNDKREPISAGCISRKQTSSTWMCNVFMIIIIGIYFLIFPYSHREFTEDSLLAYFMKPAILMTAPVIGLYLFALGQKTAGSPMFILGLIVTILSFTYGLATGVRGQVIGPCIWLLFLFLFVQKNQHTLYAAITGVLIILALQSSMLEIRNVKEHRERSHIERIQDFLDKRMFWTATERGNIFDSMEFRFGEASRLSVAFIRLAHDGHYAYLEPIKSALFAPMPRRFFEDKPLPGSVDGTKQGMGMHIIQDVMRNEPWNMSDFFTGVHAYWELGIFGVVLFSMLSGAFVALLANFFSRLNLAGLPLMMVALKPWWNEPKLWISEIILQVIHIFFPLLIIWIFVKALARFRGYFSKQKTIVFHRRVLPNLDDR